MHINKQVIFLGVKQEKLTDLYETYSDSLFASDAKTNSYICGHF